MAARKLGDEQRRLVAQQYLSGDSIPALAREFEVGTTTIRRVLIEQGVDRRSFTEATALQLDKENILDVASISKARWSEIYWGSGSGYPSVFQLGKRFGVSYTTIQNHLDKHGIKRRTASEQKKIDMKNGRQPAPPKQIKGPYEKGDPSHPWAKANSNKGKSGLGCRDTRFRSQADRKRRRRVTQPCSWCGELVERRASRLTYYKKFYCNQDHNKEHRRWKAVHGQEAARPIILQRMRDLLSKEPYKQLPHTFETLEKAGASIGAGDNEYAELIVDWPN